MELNGTGGKKRRGVIGGGGGGGQYTASKKCASDFTKYCYGYQVEKRIQEQLIKDFSLYSMTRQFAYFVGQETSLSDRGKSHFGV